MMENKYKVNDKVVYVDANDANKKGRVGTIIEVSKTDVYEWNKNKEIKILYKLNTSEYYRYEEDIMELID
jgi:hypothetical protein